MKTIPTQIRIPPSMWKELQDEAAIRGWSAALLVREILKAWLEKQAEKRV